MRVGDSAPERSPEPPAPDTKQSTPPRGKRKTEALTGNTSVFFIVLRGVALPFA